MDWLIDDSWFPGERKWRKDGKDGENGENRRILDQMMRCRLRHLHPHINSISSSISDWFFLFTTSYIQDKTLVQENIDTIKYSQSPSPLLNPIVTQCAPEYRRHDPTKAVRITTQISRQPYQPPLFIHGESNKKEKVQRTAKGRRTQLRLSTWRARSS